jgi:hypothetical protein
MAPRLCTVCGIEFGGRHWRTITCSDACNLDRIRTYQKRYAQNWYVRNRDRQLAQAKKYAEEHREQMRRSQANWRENNRERIRENRRKRDAAQLAAFYALRELNLA